jgi:uncharacterized lipoprotein YbaY
MRNVHQVIRSSFLILSSLSIVAWVSSNGLPVNAQTHRTCPFQSAGAPEVSEAEQPTEQYTVSGTVSYRQRIALPSNARVVVNLQDISRADAPATVIAETTIETNGRQVPIPFTLTYDPAQLNTQGRYAVRAQIFYGDQLRWTSTRIYSVTPEDNPTDVNIQLEQVGRQSP